MFGTLQIEKYFMLVVFALYCKEVTIKYFYMNKETSQTVFEMVKQAIVILTILPITTPIFIFTTTITPRLAQTVSTSPSPLGSPPPPTKTRLPLARASQCHLFFQHF